VDVAEKIMAKNRTPLRRFCPDIAGRVVRMVVVDQADFFKGGKPLKWRHKGVSAS